MLGAYLDFSVLGYGVWNPRFDFLTLNLSSALGTLAFVLAQSFQVAAHLQDDHIDHHLGELRLGELAVDRQREHLAAGLLGLGEIAFPDQLIATTANVPSDIVFIDPPYDLAKEYMAVMMQLGLMPAPGQPPK